MRLLTNNPTKRAGLEGYGLEIVGRVPLPVRATPENLRYLTTKRDRFGHDLPGLPALVDSREPTPRRARTRRTRAPSRVTTGTRRVRG